MNENETTEIKVTLARLEEQNKNISSSLEKILALCNTFVTKESCQEKQKTNWFKTVAYFGGAVAGGGAIGKLTEFLF